MSQEEAALVLKQVREALVEVDADKLEDAEAKLQTVRDLFSATLLPDLHRELRVTARVAAASAGRLQNEVSRMSVAQFGYAPGGVAGAAIAELSGGTCG